MPMKRLDNYLKILVGKLGTVLIVGDGEVDVAEDVEVIIPLLSVLVAKLKGLVNMLDSDCDTLVVVVVGLLSTVLMYVKSFDFDFLSLFELLLELPPVDGNFILGCIVRPVLVEYFVAFVVKVLHDVNVEFWLGLDILLFCIDELLLVFIDVVSVNFPILCVELFSFALVFCVLLLGSDDFVDDEFFEEVLWCPIKDGNPNAAYGSAGFPKPGKFNPDACNLAK